MAGYWSKTYEEREALEAKMAKVRVEKYREIVKELGDGWKVEERLDADGRVYGYMLVSADGMRFFVGKEEYNKPDRIKISASVPSDPINGRMMGLREWGLISYKERAPTATAAISRPAAAIAKDFKRKVIDPYAEMFPKLLEKIEERKRDGNAALMVAEELAGMLGMEYRPDGWETAGSRDIWSRGDDDLPSLTVNYAGSVDIKRWGGIAPNKAKALIRFLKSEEYKAA